MPPNFDRLAPHYEWLERISFGRSLQACRVAMLSRVAECRKVLIVGDGDGRFLEAFLKTNSTAVVDTLDISPAMLELAQRRISVILGANERVRFHRADVRHDSLPGAGYDLIVTNFLLDCFPQDELNAVVQRLSAVAASNGQWIVGDFENPAHPGARFFARLMLAGMYAFFRIVTGISARSLVDPSPFLMAGGWVPVAKKAWHRGFLVSRLWQRLPTDS
jgi:ubiquinone/menaquinone biosynthesis C-methylase UbiE